MKALNITLMFDGQAEKAFLFYQSIFGGEFLTFQRLKEMPSPMPLSAEDGEKMLHISLPLAAGNIAGMDIPPGRGPVNQGNNFMISLDTDSKEENDRLFHALAEGGAVMMPLADQFWGAYFGMLTDQFGITWMLSFVA